MKHLMNSVPTLACVLLLASLSFADWPQFTGPSGTTAHPADNPPLIKDISQARLVWESEIRDLPASKLYVTNKLPVPSGGMQDLIKVGDTLIYAHMWPSGEDLANERIGKGGCKLDRKLLNDDVIVAIDAKTGKTRWRKVYEQNGVYCPPTKRGGYGVYPASDGEAVYWLGSGGVLYALSVDDGSEIWQVRAEPLHRRMQELIAERRANGKRGRQIDMLSSVVVVGDTVVAPMFTRSEKKGFGYDLAGFDKATGKRRWLAPSVIHGKTTPVIWRDETGQPYLLVAEGALGRDPGKLRMIDPRDGTVVWEMITPLPQIRQLAVNGDHVFLSEPASQLPGKGGKPEDAQTFSAWRVSLDGATKIWTMPDEEPYRTFIDGDSKFMAKIMPAGDRLYFSRQIRPKDGGRRFIRVQEHDAATGKLLRSVGGLRGCWANIVFPLNNNKLLFSGDTEHWHLGCPDFTFIDAGGDALRVSGKTWKPGGGNGPGGLMKHWSVTAYEVPMAYFVSDGFLYLRGIGGPGVRCFDLRKQPKTVEANPE